MTTASSTLLGRPVWYELHDIRHGRRRDVLQERDRLDRRPFEGSPTPYTAFSRKGGVSVAGLMKTPEGMHFPPFWSMYIAVPKFDDAVAHIKRLGGSELSPVIDIPIGRTHADAEGSAGGRLLHHSAGVLPKNGRRVRRRSARARGTS